MGWKMVFPRDVPKVWVRRNHEFSLGEFEAEELEVVLGVEFPNHVPAELHEPRDVLGDAFRGLSLRQGEVGKLWWVSLGWRDI